MTETINPLFKGFIAWFCEIFVTSLSIFILKAIIAKQQN